ncbi:MAG: DUF4918 family protein [Bacteroidetes bacterium]|nr:DUF4918 family protein [Bacteroidota bacterium]
MTLADQINHYNESLELEIPLELGVEVMNPFTDEQVRKLARQFYDKYYSDNNTRQVLLGINPGRFGAGVTGIPFTDPVKLQDNCGIDNPFKKSREASSDFIFDMINAYGGPKAFYSKYFVHAVCPLGFLREGLNYNYYDDPKLQKQVTPFIIESIKTILGFGMDTSVCYCIGNGKNFKFLNKLNAEQQFFGAVIPLPHPRWVVQYRRKRYDEYIGLYLKTLI